MLDIKRPTNMTTEESAELLLALENAGITKGHLKQVSVNKGLAREIAVLLNDFLEGDLAYVYTLILSPKEQIEVWKKANRQGELGIDFDEFNFIPSPPSLTLRDRGDGFVGTCLFYGFGGGDEHSDLVLSGKKAWDYIGLLRKI